MGCRCCSGPVSDRLQDLEARIYRVAEIPQEIVQKFYVEIKMSDGTVHWIWTVIIDDEIPSIRE